MDTSSSSTTAAAPERQSRSPRLAFVGLGWIGLNRLKAARELSDFEVSAVVDVSDAARNAAYHEAPDAAAYRELHELPYDEIDGVVIATPSAQHAQQAIRFLRAGKAVFCQKPLGRNTQETESVLQAARNADRLLDVDFCYRHIRGMDEMRRRIQKGTLGKVFAAELVFHNAYGPDKPWFYDARQSGGGCLVDLGTHLFDLAAWMLDGEQIEVVRSDLYQQGRRLTCEEIRSGEVEDFAQIVCQTDQQTSLHVACSWNLSIGGNAAIEANFYGTDAAVRLRNEEDSFFDFTIEEMNGVKCRSLGSVDRNWGGRRLAAWIRRLAESPAYDPAIETVLTTARLIDDSYQELDARR